MWNGRRRLHFDADHGREIQIQPGLDLVLVLLVDLEQLNIVYTTETQSQLT